MNPERLAAILSQFKNRSVAVIGDFFLDKYLFFDRSMAGVSLETGKVANRVVAVRCSAGAAGNVASNLLALQAGIVYAVGFIGDDGEGFELRRALNKIGCDTSNLLVDSDSFTPTYIKPQDIAVDGLSGESERFDIENMAELSDEIETKLMQAISKVVENCDVLVIVDQAEAPECGAITYNIRSHISQLAKHHLQKVFWVDSRLRAGLFESVILKCNANEILTAIGESNAPHSFEYLSTAGSTISRRTGKTVYVTVGKSGSLVCNENETCHIEAVEVKGEIDPTGAGDNVTAAAAMALASGANYNEAALIGNLAGSVTVRKLRTTGTSSPVELIEALKLWHSSPE